MFRLLTRLKIAVAARIDRRIEHVVNQRLLPRGPEAFDYYKNRWLAASVTSASYALDRMRDVQRFDHAGLLLAHAISQSGQKGLFLEFGVYSGYTINLIAKQRPDTTIYGFDSFRGIPDEWYPGVAVGTFDRDGVTPPVEHNVELVVGWFGEVLPGFTQAHPGPVSFLHIDCDTYPSTVTVLTSLADRIVPGTIVVFDEYMNFPEWEKHEFKAWKEFIAARGLAYEYIGIVPAHMQVAVRVLAQSKDQPEPIGA